MSSKYYGPVVFKTKRDVSRFQGLVGLLHVGLLISIQYFSVPVPLKQKKPHFSSRKKSFLRADVPSC